MDLVRMDRRGAVALLTLSRPDALNSLDTAMLDALIARCAEVAVDGSLRALVLTGAGRAFAAGADIAEMRGHDAGAAERFSRLGHRATASLEALSIPTIAAVNGYALGGGCELALACDWIYASEKARFGQPEVNLGLIPGFGGTSRLPRRVGAAWAKELVLTGEPLRAEEALRIGLVNRVFPPDALLEAALKAGATIASRGKRYRPTLLRARMDPISRDSEFVEAEPLARVNVTNDSHWDRIISAMNAVMQGRRGTARAVGMDAPFTIAGKSGTAQVFTVAQDEEYESEELQERMRDHALFVAFAPLEDPQIAVAVVVENGQSGSGTAAPIARAVIETYLEEQP